jgi:hypothetical protein
MCGAPTILLRAEPIAVGIADADAATSDHSHAVRTPAQAPPCSDGATGTANTLIAETCYHVSWIRPWPSTTHPSKCRLAQGLPRSLASFPDDTKPMAGAYDTDSDEIFSATQLYHYCLEPSVRLLAQTRVVDMGAMRPGLYGGKVGLYPACTAILWRTTRFMQSVLYKYIVISSIENFSLISHHLNHMHRNHPKVNEPPAMIYPVYG